MSDLKRKEGEPICQFMYATSAKPDGPRCLKPLSEHGFMARLRHGFVREFLTCKHTIDGKRCGVQQMHPCHDPKYGGTHMFSGAIEPVYVSADEI